MFKTENLSIAVVMVIERRDKAKPCLICESVANLTTYYKSYRGNKNYKDAILDPLNLW